MPGPLYGNYKAVKLVLVHIRRYQWELYDRPDVHLDLGTPMVKIEAIDALLYGCVTWTSRYKHYRKLGTVHHWVLLHTIAGNFLGRLMASSRMTVFSS